MGPAQNDGHVRAGRPDLLDVFHRRRYGGTEGVETYHIRFHHLVPLHRADVLDESLNVIPGVPHDGGDQRHAKFGKESVGNQSGVGEVRTYKGYFFYIHYRP